MIGALLAFLGGIVLCVLSYAEHERSLRPSAILSGYMLSLLLADCVQATSLSWNRKDEWLFVPISLSFCFKVAILVLEEREKADIFLDPHDRLRSPEEICGLVSRSLFFWLNDFIIAGGKTILVPEDLFPLDENLTSDCVYPKFWSIWDNCECYLVRRALGSYADS